MSYEERIAVHYSHRINFKFTDLTDTVGLTKTILLTPSMADFGCRKAAVRVKTAGVGTTTLTLKVGDGGVVDRFMTAADLMATAGTWVALTYATEPFLYPSATADTVDALFTATVTNLSTLTAGEWDLYLDLVDMSKMKS